MEPKDTGGLFPMFTHSRNNTFNTAAPVAGLPVAGLPDAADGCVRSQTAAIRACA